MKLFRSLASYSPWAKIAPGVFYSPSPGQPAACWSAAEIPLKRGCRDEWRGDPPKLEERRRVGFGEFRFDTPKLAAGSFIAGTSSKIH